MQGGLIIALVFRLIFFATLVACNENTRHNYYLVYQIITVIIINDFLPRATNLMILCANY